MQFDYNVLPYVIIEQVWFMAVQCPLYTRNKFLLYPCIKLCLTELSIVDIDECAEGRSGCAQNCSNTIGSYSCSCNASYRLSADERSCNGKWQLCRPLC